MIKQILLTGATGFLGSHLLEALLEQGYSVVILKRFNSDVWRINHLIKEVKTYDVDCVPLEQAFKDQQIDAVIHTACNYGRNGEQPHEIAETNLLFSLRLLDAATLYKTNTFVNTDTLLPKNLNAYSLSKKHFIEWLQKKSQNIQVINLKLEHMYGPKDDTTKFVPWVISQFQQNTVRLPLTLGLQLRDFIYIDDVVSAYLLTLKNSKQLQAFNEFEVGTGELISVKDFVTALHIEYKKQHPSNHTALGFGDIPLRDGEMMSSTVNNIKLKKLGWQVMFDFEHGVTQLLAVN